MYISFLMLLPRIVILVRNMIVKIPITRVGIISIIAGP